MTIDFCSLIAAIFIGGTAALLGSLMITKRMALTGDALGHIALPGIGLALVLGLNISIGAFIFLLASILIIWSLEQKTELPTDALFGVIFVLSLAVGFLVVPEPEILHALLGNISSVSFADTVVSVILSTVIFIVLLKIYSKIILISISGDLAVSGGTNIKKYNLIYLILLAVVVAMGVKITGSLLVGAMLIVPASSARNISRNLRQYFFFSIIFGVLSCTLGIFFSGMFGLPTGPSIILVSIIFFAVSLFFRR